MSNVPRYFNEEKITFSTNDAGKTGHQHAKNESRHRTFIFHKIYFKIDHRPKSKWQSSKNF